MLAVSAFTFQFFFNLAHQPQAQNLVRRDILLNFERSFHVKIYERLDSLLSMVDPGHRQERLG